jgi:hypothetical protein
LKSETSPPQSPQLSHKSKDVLTTPLQSPQLSHKSKDVLTTPPQSPSSPSPSLPQLQSSSPLPSSQRLGIIQQIPPTTQPFVSMTSSGIAILTTTDYDQFIELNAYSLLLNAIYTALVSSNYVIFDVRSIKEVVKSTSVISLTMMYLESLKLFLNEDLPLPTFRHRIFHGYPEHRRGSH